MQYEDGDQRECEPAELAANERQDLREPQPQEVTMHPQRALTDGHRATIADQERTYRPLFDGPRP